MPTYKMRHQRRKPFRLADSQQGLFEWAASRVALDPPAAPLEPAVRHVARRLRLSPHHARTVAELAGLNLEACE
jgi:hypothetical protein